MRAPLHVEAALTATALNDRAVLDAAAFADSADERPVNAHAGGTARGVPRDDTIDSFAALFGGQNASLLSRLLRSPGFARRASMASSKPRMSG